MGRRAISTCDLAGYRVAPRSFILFSQLVMHHDERFFPNPQKFEPDRFLAEHEEGRPKFSYFPFGGGNRVCIGEQFAWMEGILLLATLGQKWRMRLSPGHPVAMQPLITLRPRNGMKMALERRVPSLVTA